MRFLRGLFAGEAQASSIVPYPRADAGEKESLDLLLESFRRFAERSIDAAAIDREKQVPPAVIRVADDEMVPENLDTLDSIVQYLARKRGA